MKYKVSDIMKDVRVILDSNDVSTQLLDTKDMDTLTLDELIKSKITDAAKFCVSNASVHLLGTGKPLEDISVFWDRLKGLGSGYFILPPDFYRLVTFQMSDWVIPLHLAISEDDPLYARQKSRYGGIKGNPQRPVAAIVNHPEGQVIEFYSCKGGEDVYVKFFRYIPIPKIETSYCEVRKEVIIPDKEEKVVKVVFEQVPVEYIEISEKIYDAVKYYTAYLVSLTLGMDMAASLIEITKTYLQ